MYISTKKTITRKAPATPKSVGFKGFVDETSGPLPRLLPMVHMTDAFGVRGILQSGKIEPRLCRHFTELLKKEEHLSYFFYGRASYRPRLQSTTKNNARYPVALIIAFDPTQHSIKRIFPFDTGACFEKMYETWLHDRMKVMEFCLGDIIESAQKNISRFFNSNENYIDGKATAKIDVDPAEFEIANFHSMINNVGDTKVDNRKSSIEIQFDKPIELSKSKILGVIVPETLMSSELLKSLVEPHNIKPTPYELSDGSTSECDGVLIIEAKKLLRNFLT